MRVGGMLLKVPCNQVTSMIDEVTGFLPWSVRQVEKEKELLCDANAQTHSSTPLSNPQLNNSTNFPPPPPQANLPSPSSQPSQTTNSNQKFTFEEELKFEIFYDNPLYQDDSWSESEFDDYVCEKESFIFPLFELDIENEEIVIQNGKRNEKEEDIMKNVASLLVFCAFLVVGSYVEHGKTKEKEEVVETFVIVNEKGRCEERRKKRKKKMKKVEEKRKVGKKMRGIRRPPMLITPPCYGGGGSLSHQPLSSGSYFHEDCVRAKWRTLEHHMGGDGDARNEWVPTLIRIWYYFLLCFYFRMHNTGSP